MDVIDSKYSSHYEDTAWYVRLCNGDGTKGGNAVNAMKPGLRVIVQLKSGIETGVSANEEFLGNIGWSTKLVM